MKKKLVVVIGLIFSFLFGGTAIAAISSHAYEFTAGSFTSNNGVVSPVTSIAGSFQLAVDYDNLVLNAIGDLDWLSLSIGTTAFNTDEAGFRVVNTPFSGHPGSLSVGGKLNDPSGVVSGTDDFELGWLLGIGAGGMMFTSSSAPGSIFMSNTFSLREISPVPEGSTMVMLLLGLIVIRCGAFLRAE
jgi:hypothetical protein